MKYLLYRSFGNLEKENDLDYILIDGEYKIDMALF